MPSMGCEARSSSSEAAIIAQQGPELAARL
jgi:hypothetical protein